MLRQDLIERFRKEVRNIKSEDKVAIIHHSDTDGTCSAVIIAKTIEKLCGKCPEIIINTGYAEWERYQKILPRLSREKANIVICADVSLDSDKDFFKEIEEFAKIIFLDHHKIYNDLNSGKTTFIKVQYISDVEPSQYCAAKLCYDLFSYVKSLPECSWLATLGILGDCGIDTWKDFVDKSLKEHNLTMDDLHKLMNLIVGVEVVAQDKFYDLFLEFYNAKKPQDLFDSKLYKFNETYQKELTRLVKEFEKNSQTDKELELVLFEFKSPYEVKSAIVNKISHDLYPKKTVVVIQDKGDHLLRFSARRQDFKVKMNDLLENACKGLTDAGAGGHIPAAAGKINREDLEKFKEKLKNVLKSGAAENKQ